MSALEVFFWFCKEQKIMDIIFKKYHKKTPKVFKYSENGVPYQSNLSLKDAIDYCASYGFNDIFWRLFSSGIDENERYRKARTKWNSFVKNNILFSDKFVKVGDTIEFNHDWQLHKIINGIVSEIPKNFNGSVLVRTADGNAEMLVNLLGRSDLKINGEERTPEFYIKRRRKLYGVDKR
jgi:hypothetical protein